MPDYLITHETIDTYLKDLAGEYRELTHGKAEAELVIAGGGAILLNHTFRDATNDIDAMIGADSALKDAIRTVADRYGLPSDWINSDFEHTSSFSSKLREVSTFYKTFSNVLEVRTVPDEYLIAMKLESGREYKHDLSDIIGIVKEDAENEAPILKEKIIGAVEKLYGDKNAVSDKSWEFIDHVLKTDHYESLFNDTIVLENENRDLLETFQEDYPDAVRKDNVSDILEAIKDRGADDDEEGPDYDWDNDPVE